MQGTPKHCCGSCPHCPVTYEQRLRISWSRRSIEEQSNAACGTCLTSPEALASGEVDSHFDNPLGWVGRIRAPAVWNRLVRLRRLALGRELDRVASLLASTLAQIDMMRAAEVIDRQVRNAPTPWQPALRRQALEMTRDATIRTAQGVAFEGVLRRLENATTVNRFKIWAEGPTDCPSVEQLAHEVPGAEDLNIVVQSLGGWGTMLSPHWTSAHLGGRMPRFRHTARRRPRVRLRETWPCCAGTDARALLGTTPAGWPRGQGA